MTEKRYALDEAADELARRDCAASGHAPSIEMRDYDQEVGTWLCRCHAVTWAWDNPPNPTLAADG